MPALEISFGRSIELDFARLDQAHHAPGCQGLSGGSEIEDRFRSERPAGAAISHSVGFRPGHGAVLDISDDGPGDIVLRQQSRHLFVERQGERIDGDGFVRSRSGHDAGRCDASNEERQDENRHPERLMLSHRRPRRPFPGGPVTGYTSDPGIRDP
jgi:hypothetical protein